MKKIKAFPYLLVCLLACFWLSPLYSQVIDQLHGDQAYSTYGQHSGNQINTHFWNDGQIGIRRYATAQIGGEWPTGSGHTYLAKEAAYVGSEVRGTDGVLRHIVSESNGTRAGQNDHSAGDYDPDTGLWWTFTPLPGFHNPSPPPEVSDQPKVAMSHQPWSWPASWPDRFDDAVDPGWPGSWNGYFGKDIRNADQESYYVIDDYNNREFPFYPDSTNLDRRGLGLRASVRGFQWSHIVVEDVLFWLWDVQNVGTHLHDKMVFGVESGPDIGGDGDSGDDGGKYDLELDFGWHYDGDGIGTGSFTPVGLLGLAFFESPGNPFDGIDNDGDGKDGAGVVITEDMFEPRTVNAGDRIVLINYNTFERTVTTMPAEGAIIKYLDREITILPGALEEIQNNLIDDNLNGLIDESNGSIFGEGETAVERRLYLGLKYVDYLNGGGNGGNLLIDERRDDGIDNDRDWDIRYDDVGLDGAAGTGDFGEGDGTPTSGVGTLLPGEPHIDKTDIDESDMIGLTSFNIYTSQPDYALSLDENLWEGVTPGFLNALGQIANTDIILGSGYFPLKPGNTERFSLGYIMGLPDFPGSPDGADLIRNKRVAESAYLANYNFAQAPIIPTVRAYAEDGRVRLFWDSAAEESFDPLTKTFDFEGYKIYRSTDRAWNDMDVLTDRFGATSAREPIAQFDLDNNVSDFAAATANGLAFYLGNNTGLQHTFVDSNVTNGQLYYYAVTAYDAGVDSVLLFPSETSRFIIVQRDGKIEKGRNVVIVRPEAPVAGFVGPKVETQWLAGSTTNGTVNVALLDKTQVQDRTYRVTFRESSATASLWKYAATRDFSVFDVTNPSAPDTLLENSTVFGSIVSVPGVSAFELLLENAGNVFSTAPAANLIAAESGWSRPGIYAATLRAAFFTPPSGTRITGVPKANNYRIEIGASGAATSTALTGFPAVSVNFKVINTSLGREVPFVFDERDGSDGALSGFTTGTGASSDYIYFLEPDKNDSLVVSWQFQLSRSGADSTTQNPSAGDVYNLVLQKPFLAHDVLEFTTKSAHVDDQLAKSELEDIKVVPNPYIVANSWEPENLYSTGRGPRELHFINLPPNCTIRIFNVRGQLVETLEHASAATNENSTFWNGTAIWDMLTKDGLDIAFGVYIYHVEAPGIGEKIGKFAVIK